MSEGDQLGLRFPAGRGAHRSAAADTHSEPLIVAPHRITAPAMVSGNEIPIAPLPSQRLPVDADHRRRMRPLEEMENEIIRFAISHYRGQMSEVARRLKIGRSTLYRKLDEASADDRRGRRTRMEEIAAKTLRPKTCKSGDFRTFEPWLEVTDK